MKTLSIAVLLLMSLQVFAQEGIGEIDQALKLTNKQLIDGWEHSNKNPYNGYFMALSLRYLVDLKTLYPDTLIQYGTVVKGDTTWYGHLEPPDFIYPKAVPDLSPIRGKGKDVKIVEIQKIYWRRLYAPTNANFHKYWIPEQLNAKDL